MNTVPGIVPKPPDLSEGWQTIWFKKRPFSYRAVVGQPLLSGYVGQMPKKVIKQIERIWKDLNPAKYSVKEAA